MPANPLHDMCQILAGAPLNSRQMHCTDPGFESMRQAIRSKAKLMNDVMPDGLPTVIPVALTREQEESSRGLATTISAVMWDCCARATESFPYLGLQHENHVRSNLFDACMAGRLPVGTMVHYDSTVGICVVSVQHPVFGVWMQTTFSFYNGVETPKDASNG